MNVQNVNFNILYFKKQIKTLKPDNLTNNQIFAMNTANCDCVTFSGVANGGEILKKLAAYNVPDMYTGQIMLDPKILEELQNRGVFNFPLKKNLKILSKYENTMMPVEKNVLNILKKISENEPEISLSEAMQKIYPVHKKLLLRAQQPIFEEIMGLACDLPPNLYNEFIELMNVTTKRLINDPVILPFSEREFLYKLKRIQDNIYLKNNKNEILEINKLVNKASKIFNNDIHEKRRRNIQEKLKIQMKPKILKRNLTNLAQFRHEFEMSSLYKNEEIVRLLDVTSAKIQGFPTFAQFEKKAFIHEMQKITKKLDDKNYANKFETIAQKLPTSKENISAFIVKYANDSNDKIGTNLLLGGTCSIDHLVAKKNGGANRLSNYGLTSIAINNKKSNTLFDEWVREYPEIRENCQKYVDRLIELHKQGIFYKISRNHKKITKSYIEDFASTIYKISPVENRINLDLRKLYE